MAFCRNRRLNAGPAWGVRIALATGISFLFFSIVSAQQLTSGSNSRTARDEAIKAIPLQELTPEAQTKLTSVLQNTSIFRRLPLTSIEVDPEYFVFLCRYPEIVVETWRLMGVTQMSTARTGPFTFHSNDGSGTISDVELVYGTDNVHVYFGNGSYEGPVLRKPINGQCVLLLKTEYGNSETGKKTATSQLDVFLKIDNTTAGVVAKTLNPIVGRSADQNFVESLKFVQRLNETTEKNGPGVSGMAYRLTGLSPEVRQLFVDVAGRVFEKRQIEIAREQKAFPTTMTITPEQAPIRYTNGAAR